MPEKRRWTPQEKAVLLKRHLVEKVEVSKICEESRLQPTQFYRWQQDLFENAALVFERLHNGRQVSREKTAQEQKIAVLEAKLQQKNEVLSELMEEHLALKKKIGDR